MQSDRAKRLSVLNKLYRIYDQFTATPNIACHKGCSVCCTRNVTLTTLEAQNLLQNLNEDMKSVLMTALSDTKQQKRLIPKVTINKMAELCMEGKELPDEESDPAWGPCPFLSDDSCPVYTLRPFACRCMVSEKNCDVSGHAHMNDFLITVNNVFMQYIEHIDTNGYSGNFTDVLLFMDSSKNREQYETGSLKPPENLLIKNQAIRMLMVPPEHRELIQPLLLKFKEI